MNCGFTKANMKDSAPRPTRFSKIANKDLSDWRVWHDAAKNRYSEDYEELGFWHTLDSKIVALTFKIPVLGVIPRIIFSIFTNRYEPYPIANTDEITDLWQGGAAAWRWLKWHIRNPVVDLRKFYLGFGYAKDVKHISYKWGKVRWAKFYKIPFRIPFPVLETKWFKLGWKQRGILSASLK